jgi:hypothetical protein
MHALLLCRMLTLLFSNAIGSVLPDEHLRSVSLIEHFRC